MATSPLWQALASMPGSTTPVDTVDADFLKGPLDFQYMQDGVFDGGARDAGNTSNTTFLRPGLLLGRLTASDKLTDWDPFASDGSENLVGINPIGLEMQPDGSNEDKFWGYVEFGHLICGQLIIPGETNFGIDGADLEYLAAQHLLKRGFRLNQPKYRLPDLNDFGAISATSTLTADAHAGKTYTDLGATGATTITIPNPLPGLTFRFATVTTQVRTIRPVAADKIIGTNEAANDYAATGDDVLLNDIGAVATLTGVKYGSSDYRYLLTIESGNVTVDDAR